MNIIAATEVHVNQMIAKKNVGAFKTGELQMEVNKLTLSVRLGIGATAQESGEDTGR